MNSYSGLLLACIGALFAGGTARADLIGTPADIDIFTNYAYWYVGCDYEYGCDSYFETNNYTYSFLQFTSIQHDDFVNVNAVDGTYFAYGEVDGYSQTDQAYDSALDYIIYDNGYEAGPVTFSFDTDYSAILPDTVASFGTTLYSSSPFNAIVSAYDLEGNLLGTTTFSSTEHDDEVYAYYFQPTYSAFVGIADLSSDDIASLVISTSASDSTSDYFGIGTIGVTYTPEPRTLAMTMLATGLLCVRRRRFRGVHRSA